MFGVREMLDTLRIEQTILELKLLFFQMLYEWVLGHGIFSFHSLVVLIDFCTL